MRISSRSSLVAAAVGLAVVAFAAGLLLPWDAARSRVAALAGLETAPTEAEAHAGHAELDHIDLSPTARANLGLKSGRIRLTDFVRMLHIPGEIVEAPGYSTADVPARVAGIVSAIHVAPGQAVKPGDPLFELDLTGEALAEAQSRLLDDLQQLVTLEAELERLGPLTEGGTVAAKERLRLQYDRREIEGKRNTRVQELLVRGLTRAQVDKIITNRELIRSVTVVAPPFPETKQEAGTPLDAPSAAEPSAAGDAADWEYTIETINVHPGESVSQETSLARLARHTRLLVEGHAFEMDVPAVAALGGDQRVSVEFGGEYHGGIDGPVSAIGGVDAHGEVVDGLKVLYIDNHVEAATQTFAFYVPLENRLLRDSVDDSGRVFRSWKFKPGQRVHVRVPLERLEEQIVLPAAAVVTQGPEAYVFRLAGRHAVEGEGGEGDRQYAEEYKQVPVAVRFRDRESVVIAAGGNLKEGDIVALNRAYQLLLALNSAAEGGSGGHDHHGHQH